jgi:hypothetical protein
MKQINSREAYWLVWACTKGAEEFFSWTRRRRSGTTIIAGAYVIRYSQEGSWQEEHRRMDNVAQVSRAASLALAARPSVDFCGYWQRAEAV